MDEVDKQQQEAIEQLQEGHEDQASLIKITLALIVGLLAWMAVVSAALIGQTIIKNDVTITIKARK